MSSARCATRWTRCSSGSSRVSRAGRACSVTGTAASWCPSSTCARTPRPSPSRLNSPAWKRRISLGQWMSRSPLANGIRTIKGEKRSRAKEEKSENVYVSERSLWRVRALPAPAGDDRRDEGGREKFEKGRLEDNGGRRSQEAVKAERKIEIRKGLLRNGKGCAARFTGRTRCPSGPSKASAHARLRSSLFGVGRNVYPIPRRF